MKEYINTPEEGENTVNEPAVAYEVAQPRQDFFALFDVDDMDDDIPLDENGDPIGHTVDEVFDAIDLDWSETSGIDFVKLSRMIRSGEVDLNEMTDERLHSPEFKYEPYLGFTPKPRKKVEYDPEFLKAMKGVFEDEDEEV
jgi:hypothetical protein